MMTNVGVLIPTSRRPHRIKELLNQFEHISTEMDFNIYIAENGDASQLEDVIALFPKLSIKHILAGEWYLTAEENLFRNWDHVQEDYVWILGDDDIINFASLHDLVERCSSKELYALKYNSRFVTEDGQHLDYFTSRMSTMSASMDVNSIVSRLGFWHTLASFSTWVIRKDQINSDEAINWLKAAKSPIYSHVSFFIHVLKDREIYFINIPLVYYRINPYVNGENHWENFAKEIEKPRYYPWTVGFASQLIRLIDEGAIEIESIRSSIGDHLYTRPFSEINSMINMFVLQLLLDLKGRSLTYSKNDLELMLKFLRRIRPELVDLLTLVESIMNKSNNSGKQLRKKRLQLIKKLINFQKLWQQNMNIRPAEHLLVGRVNGYEVYKIGSSFVSTTGEGCIFDFITLELENTDNFFSDDSLSNLSEKLKLLPILRTIIPTEQSEGLSEKFWIVRILRIFLPIRIKVFLKKLIA